MGWVGISRQGVGFEHLKRFLELQGNNRDLVVPMIFCLKDAYNYISNITWSSWSLMKHPLWCQYWNIEMWNSCTFLCKNHDYFYCIADICSTNAGSLQNTKLLSLQRFRAMHGRNIHFFPDQIVLGLKAPMLIQWLFEISQFGSLSRNARQAGWQGGCRSWG